MNKFSHIDQHGKARMVDVLPKPITHRRASAGARVRSKTRVSKEAIVAAELAGAQAAQRTATLIPLCHPLPIERIVVRVQETHDGYDIRSDLETHWRTGIEVDALCSVTFAALTLLTALAAEGEHAFMEDVCVLEKHGGRSGSWGRQVQ